MKKLVLVFMVVASVFASEKICETRQDKIDGCVLKEYQDGVLIRETPYKNNQINGILKEYQNGSLLKSTQYENDKINGIVKEYFPNTNQLKYQAEFKNDIKYGKEITYYQNGQIYHTFVFENDKLIDGEHTDFYPNGNKYSTFNIKNDVFDGKFVVYNENGKLALEADYKNGEFLGGKCGKRGNLVPKSAGAFNNALEIAKLCEQDFLF